MLINLSNHPSDKWDEKQKNAAIEQYGRIEDIQFPAVDPYASENDIAELAEKYLNECLLKFEKANISDEQKKFNNAVHIQGEFTFVYRLVNMLKEKKIKCIASTSERNVIKEKDGTKTLIFNFVRFRDYF